KSTRSCRSSPRRTSCARLTERRVRHARTAAIRATAAATPAPIAIQPAVEEVMRGRSLPEREDHRVLRGILHGGNHVSPMGPLLWLRRAHPSEKITGYSAELFFTVFSPG